jgi:hypothetical protein
MTTMHRPPISELQSESGTSLPGDQRISDRERWIEVDLSDLRLSSDMSSLDHRAEVAAHIYERFVPYADEGWEWVIHPASRRFDTWVTEPTRDGDQILAARLLCRRAEPDAPHAPRASHGLSGYRTRQLTRRLWSAEPASKIYRPLS